MSILTCPRCQQMGFEEGFDRYTGLCSQCSPPEKKKPLTWKEKFDMLVKFCEATPEVHFYTDEEIERIEKL